jgi:tRNA(Ile)-lysidine synthase
MADRTELAFRSAALRLIPDGARILAAVSGGPDSVALLHLLARHAPPRGLEIAVAHLDHALRPGSAADRRFVERLASDLELRCFAERRGVADLRRRDESLEEAARRVRRTFLLAVLKRSGADRIATGHTLDDQAETVLMRLVRGGGPTSLGGMAESGPGPFVRPLLRVERRDLRAYLERRHLPYRDDPTNRDPRFDRNRVRRLVLPLLSEALNPRAARHIVEAAERLRDDASALDGLAAEQYRKTRRRLAGRKLRLAVGPLAAAPVAIASRLVRFALLEAGADPRRIAAPHLEGVRLLAHAPPGKAVDLPGRIRALRSGSGIILESRAADRSGEA